jgi:Ca-activated chloride channel family protein
MHILRAAFTLSLVLSTTFPVRAQTAPPVPTINAGTQSALRVNVSLVDVPVNVTNSAGQFLSGLAQGNFRVYEDGRPQQITFFENEDIPATVGLVVDHSGSMGQKLPEVSASAVALAQSSNPEDEMFVVNFNDIISLELPAAAPFTSDVLQLERAVSAVRAEGRTALNDAIIIALNQLQSSHRDRQALVIISDGGDNASRHNFKQVLMAARKSNAKIYTIGIFGPNEADQNPGALEKLAKTTGGKAFFPESVTDVALICTQIAHDIREQYVLGYSPSSADEGISYRKIEVKVDAPNHQRVRVRARAGYIPLPQATPSSQGSGIGTS